MTASSTTVPLLDLKAQYATIREEIEPEVQRVLESQGFILGPTVEQFERDVAAYLGAKHAIGCASGSDALLLPLMAMGIGAGDEVICPTFTFFATAGTIARTGATAVFADIDPATYNLDPHAVRRVAENCRNLKAIMPVHLYGQGADMPALRAVARDFDVPLIEDAAQAIGALDEDGERIGAKPLVHGWSCYPTKNLGAFGDAGFVTTSEDDLADLLRRLRVHGGRNRYYHDMVGMNSRLDALQAAVLSVKLRHLDDWNDRRRRNAAFYDDAFAGAGAKDSRSPWSEAGLPLRYPRLKWSRDHHAYHQYVVRVPADLRDDLRAHLSEHGVGNEIFYPLPLHLQECFRGLGGAEGDHPNAERIAKEVIALPIYPELSEAQLRHVASTIVAFVEQHAASASETPVP